MSLSRRALLVAIVVAAALWSSAIGATQAPSGFLLEQVVDATSGTPLDGATITLTGAKQSTPRLLTNADGQFLFRSLAAGRYQINATAAGYVSGAYGQMRPLGSSQSIDLGADEKRGNVIIKLWKQGSISGKITDEAGEPIAGRRLQFFRRSAQNGTQRFDLFGSIWAYANDKGEYRISELTPGDYLVGVMSSQVTMPAALAAAYLDLATSGNGVNSTELGRDLTSSGAPQGMFKHRLGDFVFRSGDGSDDLSAPSPSEDGKIVVYSNAFYSSAQVPSQASIVKLSAGEDRTGIDLQLRLTPTVRVSGVIGGPDGPARNMGVKLFPAGAEEFRTETGLAVAATATDANGSFTFLGVPPGRYTLKVLRVPKADPYDWASPNRPPLPASPTLWATTSITVGNADVTGLAVTLSTGAQISGRFVFEGTNPPPAASQMVRIAIQISALSGVRSNPVTDAYKRIETDGRFASVGIPPGKYTVTASLQGSPWRFKSATFAGRDIADDGLLIESADVSNVVLTFTDRATEISGTVTDSKGRADDSASVIVLPDSQSWKQGGVSPLRIRSVRATTTGTFTLSDLPPGNYFLAAVNDAELDDWQDPRTLDAIARVATRIAIAVGQKVTQNLTTRSIR